MHSSTFRVSRENHTAVLTLDNPPANTWTPDSLSEFRHLVGELSKEKEITALVIHSNSEKFFSAGADLKRFDNASMENVTVMAERFGEAFEALTDFHGVTIAAIDGYAMGGGLEVALASDLRVVSEKARLGLPEAKVGLLPCAGGTQNLTALTGEGWAKRIILCGEVVDGKTALDIGLAEGLSSNPLELATKWATQTEGVSPDSLVACKRLIQMGRVQPRRTNLTEERKLFIELFKKPNQQEGVESFLQKRSPCWNYE